MNRWNKWIDGSLGLEQKNGRMDGWNGWKEYQLQVVVATSNSG